MDPSHDLKVKLLLKEQQISRLETLVAEKEQVIAELKTKLDKFQVSRLAV